MISTKTTARLCIVLLSAACVLGSPQRLALPAGQKPGGTRRPESSSGGDAVCGPRCVQFLLKWYQDEKADLVDLVREIQWPDLESGCTLDAIDRALRKRGIHTFAMRIQPEARLQWPHPAVVHLKSQKAADTPPRVGHYVVWLPGSSRVKASVWQGLSGVKTYRNRLLEERRSGAVLLTSPIAIDDPEAALAKRSLFPAVVLALVAGGLGGVVLLWCTRRVWTRSHLLPSFKETEPCGENSA
jgi:hypothetical protein